MKKAIAGVSLLMLTGIASGQHSNSPAKGGQIAWVKDAATAQRLAQTQKKLVLQFLMLGDLSDPNC